MLYGLCRAVSKRIARKPQHARNLRGLKPET